VEATGSRRRGGSRGSTVEREPHPCARRSRAVDPLCADYLAEKARKVATEQIREETKAQNEQHRAAAFPNYETAINAYLNQFNAGYRIELLLYGRSSKHFLRVAYPQHFPPEPRILARFVRTCHDSVGTAAEILNARDTQQLA